MAHASRVGLAFALALVGGCDGQIGALTGQSSEAIDPAAPVVVGPDLPILATEGRCEPILPSERPLGVSPEGILWLVSTSTRSPNASRVRTIDPVTTATRAFEVALSDLGSAVVHGAERASVIADGGLWLVGDQTRIEVTAPFAPGRRAQLCGRLDFDAFVLDGTELYQRDRNEWIRWQGLEAVLDSGDAQLLRRDGACWASEDGLIFRGTEGQLWLLTPSSLQTFEPREGQVQLVEGRPAALNARELSIGGRNYTLSLGGPADAFATAGGWGWLRFDTTVVRFDGEGFQKLEAPAADDAALLPFGAGGLWLVDGGQACVRDPGWLRIAGVAPQERRLEGSYELTVLLEGPAREVSLSVDGAPVAPARAVDDALVFAGTLELGWQDFQIRVAEASGVTAQRRFMVKRLPGVTRSWEMDLRPVYEAHCSAAACHVENSPSGAPDLSRFEAWVALAEVIETRVLSVGDMPPLSSRDQTWTPEQAETIRQWLSGGLRP